MAIKCTPKFDYESNDKGFAATVTYSITKIGATTVKLTKTHDFSWKGGEIWENLSSAGRKFYTSQLEKTWETEFKKAVSAKKPKIVLTPGSPPEQHPKFKEFFEKLYHRGEHLLTKVKDKVLAEIESTKKETAKQALNIARGVSGAASGLKSAGTGTPSGVAKAIKNIAATVNATNKLKNAKVQVRKRGDDRLVDAKKAIDDAWKMFGTTEVLINSLDQKSKQIAVDTGRCVEHHYLQPKRTEKEQKQVNKLKAKGDKMDRTRAVLQAGNKKDFQALMAELDKMKTAVDTAMVNVNLHSKSIMERLEKYAGDAEELLDMLPT